MPILTQVISCGGLIYLLDFGMVGLWMLMREHLLLLLMACGKKMVFLSDII